MNICEMNFFVLTILLAVCSSTPICFKGREYVVEKCVRYRCINGTAMPESCPRGLFPASKDATGCSWPGESECTMDVETEKSENPRFTSKTKPSLYLKGKNRVGK